MEQKQGWGRMQVIEKMVARDGVEPPTPAFSGLTSPVVTSFSHKPLSRSLPPKLPN
jgi:hypothetical protein